MRERGTRTGLRVPMAEAIDETKRCPSCGLDAVLWGAMLGYSCAECGASVLLVGPERSEGPPLAPGRQRGNRAGAGDSRTHAETLPANRAFSDVRSFGIAFGGLELDGQRGSVETASDGTGAPRP